MLGNVTFHMGNGSTAGLQALTIPHKTSGLRATLSNRYSTSVYNDQQIKHQPWRSTTSWGVLAICARPERMNEWSTCKK